MSKCPICSGNIINTELYYKCERCGETWQKNGLIRKCKKCSDVVILVETMYLDYKDSYQRIAFPYYYCIGCEEEYKKDEVEWAENTVKKFEEIEEE